MSSSFCWRSGSVGFICVAGFTCIFTLRQHQSYPPHTGGGFFHLPSLPSDFGGRHYLLQQHKVSSWNYTILETIQYKKYSSKCVLNTSPHPPPYRRTFIRKLPSVDRPAALSSSCWSHSIRYSLIQWRCGHYVHYHRWLKGTDYTDNNYCCCGQPTCMTCVMYALLLHFSRFPWILYRQPSQNAD